MAGTDYREIARQAAIAAGIDPDIYLRQINQESGFNPNAKSPAGATGIAQFMPDTARGLGVDPNDPVASLKAAAKFMRKQLDHYHGDYAKALAAYNAGGAAVDKYGGVPPFPETQSYVTKILGDGAGPSGGRFMGTNQEAGGGTTSEAHNKYIDIILKTMDQKLLEAAWTEAEKARTDADAFSKRFPDFGSYYDNSQTDPSYYVRERKPSSNNSSSPWAEDSAGASAYTSRPMTAIEAEAKWNAETKNYSDHVTQAQSRVNQIQDNARQAATALLSDENATLLRQVSLGRLDFDKGKDIADRDFESFTKAMDFIKSGLTNASEERRTQITSATNLGIETSRALTDTLGKIAPRGTAERQNDAFNLMGQYIPGYTPRAAPDPILVDPNQVAQTAVNTTRSLLAGQNGGQGDASQSGGVGDYQPQLAPGWTSQYVSDADLANMSPEERLNAGFKIAMQLAGGPAIFAGRTASPAAAAVGQQ